MTQKLWSKSYWNLYKNDKTDYLDSFHTVLKAVGLNFNLLWTIKIFFQYSITYTAKYIIPLKKPDVKFNSHSVGVSVDIIRVSDILNETCGVKELIAKCFVTFLD